MTKRPAKLGPIPPGEVLREEFMEPLGISQNRLARDLDVPVTRIGDIVHARRGITTDTALRLGLYFSTTPDFWMNLQSQYDLKIGVRELLPRIAQRVRRCTAAD